MIDLHIHTAYSDGSDTLLEVLKQAYQKGLTQIAITDHNTLEGIKELPEYYLGMQCIRGIEITCQYQDQELHLLGYFPHAVNDFTILEHLIYRSQNAKHLAMLEMIERLQQKGIHFTYEDLRTAYSAAVYNRVHLAKMIVKLGYAEHVDEAFARYLRKNGDVYVESKRCDVTEAIDAVHACGGLAYLAHPYQYDHPFEILDAIHKELDGIEVLHSSFTTQQSQTLIDYARTHDLKMSGGSDYHGSNKIDVNLGEPQCDEQYRIVF